MTLVRTDGPRANADPAEIARKLALLDGPHVAALTAYVRRLREQRLGDLSIPWFDPTDAGVEARILMLLEAPGRRAIASQGSGFISADNDDGTAANVWYLLREAKLDRSRDTAAWNVVPWYIGESGRIRAATRADLQEARAALAELLGLFNDLRVVLLLGRAAAAAWQLLGSDFPAIAAPHPSPRNLNGRPQQRAVILEALQAARRTAGRSAPSAKAAANTASPLATPASDLPLREQKAREALPRSRGAPRVEVPRAAIREALTAGRTPDHIAAGAKQQRAIYLAALEEEARLADEFAVFPVTPESVVMLRDRRGLRWERIAVRVTGDPRATAAVRELYEKARGAGAARRSYTGRGRRYKDMR